MGCRFEQYGLVGAVTGIFRLFLTPNGVVEAFERRHHDALHCLGAMKVNAEGDGAVAGQKRGEAPERLARKDGARPYQPGSARLVPTARCAVRRSSRAPATPKEVCAFPANRSRAERGVAEGPCLNDSRLIAKQGPSTRFAKARGLPRASRDDGRSDSDSSRSRTVFDSLMPDSRPRCAWREISPRPWCRWSRQLSFLRRSA